MEKEIKTPKEVKYIITSRSIMGALADYSVQQSPYHRPDNLEIVLDKFFGQIKDDFDNGLKYIKKFDTYRDILDYIEPKLKSIPEFMLWNERKNGKQGNGFTGAGHHDDGSVTFYQAQADNDFIDLDALIRNVINLAVKD